uniref:Uncharacterized protein n=1 Tax=uncultured bacterium contig00036 TaxID=1181524 RepID=A0A806KJ39_9BACT|nr:hypothetical protein [uncultured bacterium contig00036]
MDKKSKAILAGFTGRKSHSKLAPHGELIFKLYERGCTVREIVHILFENFGLTASPSTVFRFISRLEQLEKEESKPRKTKPRKETPVPVMPFTPQRPAPVASSPDEIRRRIAELKQRPAQAAPEKKLFEYDPDQPLHLIYEDEKGKKI